jgi:hypothetical protein
MKIHRCKQGSFEWSQKRAGIPCSSAFHRVITLTGKPSSQADPFLFDLLAERILGHPLDEYISFAMERGSELEHKAVQYFTLVTDRETEEVGFITDDDERWGTSPDRSVDDGFLEVKCPQIPRHMMNLMAPEAAKKEYWIQTQGQLWIGERERTWLLSYHPDLPYALYAIERDETFIKRLSVEVSAFSDRLEVLADLAVKRGYFRGDSVRRRSDNFEERRLTELLKASLIQLKGDQHST